MSASPGDRLSNAPYQRIWTCPECHTDHAEKVKRCDGCDTRLRCEIEEQPVAVCIIYDPEFDDEEDEE